MSSTGRDEGLRRVSTLTRWAAGLGVAATGVIAGVVAHAVPGRAATPSAPAAPTATTPETAAPSTDDGSTPATVTPPTQPPMQPYNPPVVRSGAS